ncbi:alpha/beta hydrolase [Chitinophaga solisilvae]|uniref:alpha/beta hydrolase n=1 Tax=Chitinophaga solisilvae TaxID=1233460 RepID=UPI00136DDC1D|nr:alpha/beta hydrolase-fold protein [Chitinophaga solisilvae]
MKKIFLLLLSVAMIQQLSAQSLLSVHSAILGEDRPVTIILPETYRDTTIAPASYPVLYLFDGEWNTTHAAAIVQHLSKGMYAMIPEMIVVGIHNTARTRDLTPTHAPTTRPGKKGTLYSESGGGEKFISFLQQELIPYVRKNYRTSGYQVLSGHSFGGLATMNIIMHHTALFNACIAIDPSMWWEEERFLDGFPAVLQQQDMKGRKLFVAEANKVAIPQDTTTDHPRAIKRLANEILPLSAVSGLQWKHKFYLEEDHGSIPLPALYDGLKFVFNGYQTQVKQVADDYELYLRNYAAISKSNGFVFKPGESLTYAIGQYALSQQKPAAINFLLLNVQQYPSSIPAHLALAAAYLRLQQPAAALNTYRKALQLAPDNGFVKEKIRELGR